MEYTLPSVSRLREILNYDPLTGVLTWRIPRKKASVGTVAGRPRASGHIYVGVDGKKYAAHRIAWAIYYGEHPENIIDHKNCNPSDNRIDNLRIADKSKNAHNSGKWATNTSGYKCVFWNKQRGKWMVRTRIRGEEKYVGLFATKEEAHAAYAAYANENVGEFARAA